MKILIANDGSRFGHAAAHFAANIIDGKRETEVKIVAVLEPAASIDVETVIESVDELLSGPEAKNVETMLQRSEEEFRKSCDGAKLKTSHAVLAGPAARMIVETAEEWNADLIVIGTHGHGFWKRSLFGSVSDSVAHHASCSVLIVR